MLLLALLVVLLALLVFAVRRAREAFTIDRTRPVVSAVDGAAYRVHPGHPLPQAAADTLAALNQDVSSLLRSLRRRYISGAAREAYSSSPPSPPSPPGAAAAAERVKCTERLLARYNPDNLAENSPHDPGGDTSYCFAKGSVVALCLRDRGPGAALHDRGTLLFVTLHELAHIAIDEIDHPPRFWRVFKWLLIEAEDAGVYRSPNYARAPVQYCGLRVDYNPRYDPAVVPI